MPLSGKTDKGSHCQIKKENDSEKLAIEWNEKKPERDKKTLQSQGLHGCLDWMLRDAERCGIEGHLRPTAGRRDFLQFFLFFIQEEALTSFKLSYQKLISLLLSFWVLRDYRIFPASPTCSYIEFIHLFKLKFMVLTIISSKLWQPSTNKQEVLILTNSFFHFLNTSLDTSFLSRAFSGVVSDCGIVSGCVTHHLISTG